jgi:hypothetical protein
MFLVPVLNYLSGHMVTCRGLHMSAAGITRMLLLSYCSFFIVCRFQHLLSLYAAC